MLGISSEEVKIMKTYQIISDGSCDLSQDIIKENDIVVIPFSVSFDKEHSLRENVDIKTNDFYQKLIDEPDVFPYSACPSPTEYYEAFLKAVKNNLAVICICITAKFSGSYSSAVVARSQILEDYPNAKIEVIDCRCNTVLQGLFVQEAARMQKESKSFEEVVQMIHNTYGSRIFFTVSNLRYLQHGGRIGKLSAVIGKLFQINPIIVLKHGEIFSGGIAIKRKRALLTIISKTKLYFEKHKLKYDDFRFVIGYGHDKDEAIKFKQLVDKELNVDCDLSQIGITIAVHTGPEPIGLAFMRKFDHQLVAEEKPQMKLASSKQS